MSGRAARLSALWLLPFVVVVLRAAPYLVARFGATEPGTALLPIGYNPKDLLSYVAFQRQLAEDGSWLWVNPYTTEPQTGRFFLLFHAVLGSTSAATGVDSFTVLEASRIPLTFAFFAATWWLAGRIHVDERVRALACWLIGLSGGFDFAARLAQPLLPRPFAEVVAQDLWHLQGWSTFAALYNPLWIAGLSVTILTLAPILDPAGPGRRGAVAAGVGLFFLHWIHPYSAIVVAAVYAMRVILAVAFRERAPVARSVALAAAVAAALAGIGAITLWQMADPVFRRSSGGVFGSQYLSAAWYPLTLGVLGAFAFVGLRDMIAADHPWRRSLAAWLLAVIFLHNSPVLNGYHFVFQLHLPLCLVAAPAVSRAWRRLRESGGSPVRGRAKRAGLVAGLFLSSAALTWESVDDVGVFGVVPASWIEVVETLRALPPANALAPQPLGVLIPALSGHRVWVGQWFLTPDAVRRSRLYTALVERGGNPARLRELLDDERIRYLVAPASRALELEKALAGRVGSRVRVDDLNVFVLTDAG